MHALLALPSVNTRPLPANTCCEDGDVVWGSDAKLHQPKKLKIKTKK